MISSYAALLAFQFACATRSGMGSFLASASTLTSSSAIVLVNWIAAEALLSGHKHLSLKEWALQRAAP